MRVVEQDETNTSTSVKLYKRSAGSGRVRKLAIAIVVSAQNTSFASTCFVKVRLRNSCSIVGGDK